MTGAALLRTGEVRVRTDSVELGEIGAVGFQRLRGDVSPAVLAGQPLGALDDVLLGSDTFDRSGVQAGDQVTLEGLRETTQEARVVGRTILPLAGATFSDIGVVLPLDRFVELGAEDLVTDLDVASIAALEVPDGADRADLATGAGGRGPPRGRAQPAEQGVGAAQHRPDRRGAGRDDARPGGRHDVVRRW